ncbi:hypothetical protein FEDK69T_24750 [Flavobacterium enshiense DK69]|uniref:Secretion system C-terminal sorting domain-containing protein n=1 Tax=Flavobacterium enshiense DK69 TaxID=1107311 RepID=V6S3Z0_9FLAO|nr:T9SS type A sorting domain-containing protein [Flavobacterium enshiense]ESU21408.1 hypothetical protein FEDK69T_24750 [Flavobacterium enshiense DK69]KGO97082.1 hypothetical protein Q767_00310 [Flavobacterium enshiense DK69]
MNKFKILLLLLLVTPIVNSQVPNIVWRKYYGGNSGEATSILKTSDGGYVIAGIAENSHSEAVDFHGSRDGFIVKLNSLYELEWSKCYGTQGLDEIKEIKQTSDGGYIFTGHTSLPYQPGSTLTDFWIVKIDSLGNVIWEKRYGGTNEDYAKSVCEISTGGYLVTGSSRSADGHVGSSFGYDDYWVLKLDINGNIIFSKIYGGPRNDYGMSSVVNQDGSYVVLGEAFSYTGQVICRNPSTCESDFWVVKCNNSGNIIWTKCFGPNYSGSNYFSTPHKIIKTTDGGYVLIGRGNSGDNPQGATDFWVIKIDSNGNLQWKNSYGGTEHDKALSIKQTVDGGYIVVGSSYSSDGQVTVNLGQYSVENGWIIKINNNGVLQWQKTVGSSFFGYDHLSDVVEVGTNEFIAVGKSGNSNDDCFESNGRGFWVTKLATGTLNSENFQFTDFEIYPNPTENLLKFRSNSNEIVSKVIIHDISGRKVFELNSENITEVDITTLTKGVYTITISNKNYSNSRKIIKKQ